MKYNAGDHIVYQILDEIFYAVIKNTDSDFPAPNYVTIQTFYSLFAIYDNGQLGLSLESELEIKYIKGKVDANLSKNELIEKYPEYIL